jgi:RND superfamily putative drug exporter
VPGARVTAAERGAVAAATRAARATGLTVAMNGDLVSSSSTDSTEGIGVLVALIVLMITFGSVTAAGMPLLTAGIGVGAGALGIVALSALTALDSSAMSIAVMLGLAVGIDYALFIISRHRAQAQRGMELGDSVAHAVGTAGGAVVFAGSTVVVALLGLAVTGVPFLALMGACAAGTILIAVAVALTLVPALLGFAGRRAVGGKRVAEHATAHRPTLGARWIALVTRHRVAAIAIPVVAMLALAIPATHMRLGLPDDGTAPAGSTQQVAFDLLAQGFGRGVNGPLAVVVETTSARDAAAVQRIGRDVSRLHDVAAVSPPYSGADGAIAVMQVTPISGPSSAATETLVNALRSDEAGWHVATGATVLVTGATAVNIDVTQRMATTLLPYLAVVIGLALLLLVLAFRSLLVPATAVAGFLLTIGAALGAMVLVFQDGVAGWLFGITQPAPVVSLLPVLIVGILFGLSMDYEVFLVSRMHEEHRKGAEHGDAIRAGFNQSSRVVTAAALIMAAVFAGFMFADDQIIKSIGFALATGVLLDAFVIRMTLIPALLSLLGERAWWLPHGLRLVVPNLDIEGSKLAVPRIPLAYAPATAPAASK